MTGRRTEEAGERNRKKRMTGYHFISSAVELRLINALLSACCDPARAVHKGDATGKKVAYGEVVEREKERKESDVTRLHTLRYPFIIFRMFRHAMDGKIQIKRVKVEFARTRVYVSVNAR